MQSSQLNSDNLEPQKEILNLARETEDLNDQSFDARFSQVKHVEWSVGPTGRGDALHGELGSDNGFRYGLPELCEDKFMI